MLFSRKLSLASKINFDGHTFLQDNVKITSIRMKNIINEDFSVILLYVYTPNIEKMA
jgi:hypothetical protein